MVHKKAFLDNKKYSYYLLSLDVISYCPQCIVMFFNFRAECQMYCQLSIVSIGIVKIVIGDCQNFHQGLSKFPQGMSKVSLSIVKPFVRDSQKCDYGLSKLLSGIGLIRVAKSLESIVFSCQYTGCQNTWELLTSKSISCLTQSFR